MAYTLAVFIIAGLAELDFERRSLGDTTDSRRPGDQGFREINIWGFCIDGAHWRFAFEQQGRALVSVLPAKLQYMDFRVRSLAHAMHLFR